MGSWGCYWLEPLGRWGPANRRLVGWSGAWCGTRSGARMRHNLCELLPTVSGRNSCPTWTQNNYYRCGQLSHWSLHTRWNCKAIWLKPCPHWQWGSNYRNSWAHHNWSFSTLLKWGCCTCNSWSYSIPIWCSYRHQINYGSSPCDWCTSSLGC